MAVVAGLWTYAAAAAMPKLPTALHVGIELLLVVQFIVVLWLLSYFPPQECYYIKSKLHLVYTDLGIWVRQRVAG